MALDLDGRTNRWESGSDDDKEETEKKKLFKEFNEMYYKSNYGEFVNNYDQLELVKPRR
jgi:hypothetical protein